MDYFLLLFIVLSDLDNEELKSKEEYKLIILSELSSIELGLVGLFHIMNIVLSTDNNLCSVQKLRDDRLYTRSCFKCKLDILKASGCYIIEKKLVPLKIFKGKDAVYSIPSIVEYASPVTFEFAMKRITLIGVRDFDINANILFSRGIIVFKNIIINEIKRFILFRKKIDEMIIRNILIFSREEAGLLFVLSKGGEIRNKDIRILLQNLYSKVEFKAQDKITFSHYDGSINSNCINKDENIDVKECETTIDMKSFFFANQCESDSTRSILDFFTFFNYACTILQLW